MQEAVAGLSYGTLGIVAIHPGSFLVAAGLQGTVVKYKYDISRKYKMTMACRWQAAGDLRSPYEPTLLSRHS